MLIFAYRAEEIMEYLWPHDGQTLPVRPILLALSVIACVCALIWGVRAIGRGRRRTEPARLFNQAAGKLGLNWSQRWTLYRIAKRRGLSNPMTLLVCDSVLTYHTEQLAGQMGPGAGAHLQRKVAGIRDRLFGGA